jgi:DNA-directed RNA polymerase specialized sigma54-like protein
MKIRDRIKDFRRVKASELAPSPKNWRTHPKAQRDALQGLLAEIGFAGAVLARETPHGLMLIDGHLRAETAADSEIPVLILDVDEAEADKILATFDPLGAMAESNANALDALLRNVQTSNEAVANMLSVAYEQVVKDRLKEMAKEPDANEKDKSDDGEIVTFSVTVTEEHESIILSAIAIIKKKDKSIDGGEALAMIADQWMAGSRGQ